ncbi:hypothetical protein ACFL1B_02015 [Nanoarchaeota archaeon]
MRRLLLLMLVLLLITACKADVQEELSEDELVDVEEGSDEVIAEEDDETDSVIVETLPEPEDLTPEDRLAELEDRQTAVYLERADALKQKRDVLDALNDHDTSFEDRQLYQRALDILNSRISELTLEVTLLEPKIRSLKNSKENAEIIEALEKKIPLLEEEWDEYMEAFLVLGNKILDIREKYRDETSLEAYDDRQEELEPLEKQERDIITYLDDINKEINETRVRLDELKGEDLPENYEFLLIARSRVSENLNVVRNGIVETYMSMKTASVSDMKSLQQRIDALEDEEDDLEDELRDIDEKLKSQ